MDRNIQRQVVPAEMEGDGQTNVQAYGILVPIALAKKAQARLC